MVSLADIQPSFLPWRGYFDIINRVDIFVFYDDAQYDRGSWRNRNRIKTPSGSKWITVPVLTKGYFPSPINKILINNTSDWRKKHLKSIYQSYCKSPFFENYYPFLEEGYNQDRQYISDLDIYFTKKIAQILGISVKWVMSSILGITSRSTDRLVDVCKKLGASHYLSGPAAQNYIEPEKFERAGITLEYMEYNYPEYPQLHGPFEPFVSIIDLLFNTGHEAPNFIWGKG